MLPCPYAKTKCFLYFRKQCTKTKCSLHLHKHKNPIQNAPLTYIKHKNKMLPSLIHKQNKKQNAPWPTQHTKTTCSHDIHNEHANTECSPTDLGRWAHPGRGWTRRGSSHASLNLLVSPHLRGYRDRLGRGRGRAADGQGRRAVRARRARRAGQCCHLAHLHGTATGAVAHQLRGEFRRVGRVVAERR